jgi:hypothetical protein
VIRIGLLPDHHPERAASAIQAGADDGIADLARIDMQTCEVLFEDARDCTVVD